MTLRDKLQLIFGINTGGAIFVEEGCNRIANDRRRCPTPIISRYTFCRGKRKVVRRDGDRKEHIYVDLYSARLLVAVGLLLFLSCLDAYLTLELIGNGRVIEANPIMAFFLRYGPAQFNIIKFIITACCLIVLCLFKNVRVTRICLPVAIKIYLIIVGYEFYLFTV